LNPKRSLVFIMIQFIVLIPQFLYWKYLSGHFVYYSYPGEVFYWAHPMLLQIWFSPFNGLFPYHPVWFLFIAGMFVMVRQRKSNTWISIFFFLLASYIFSSWHCWFYGGSFGFRPLAEFAVFIALPLGYLLLAIIRWKNLFLRSVMVVVFLLLGYGNLMMFYHYNIFTGGMWSWDDYFIKLKDFELVDFPQKTYTWNTDFSNNFGYEPVILTNEHVRSRVTASYCNKDIADNVHYRRTLSKILDHPVSRVSMSVWVYPALADSMHAVWVCSVEKNGKMIYYKDIPFDKFPARKGVYGNIRDTIEIPEWVDQNSEIHCFIWNPKGREFYFDDMSIKFE
ncbi:MAG: hypothetical protein NTU51_02950, partial [Bacteroidetes bacterium]|nr:hypothetical protein [Bacteroidota bacterium]